MKFRLDFFSLLILVFGFRLHAQVVTSVPPFPTIEDSVVVIFNAKEGDGGLQGFTGDVYVHTGVITTASTSPSDWKYVIGTWGDNSIQPQLTNIGEDLWQLDIGDIRTFYGIPSTEKVLQLAFVFRSANTSRTGRDVGGADIFLDIEDTSFRGGIVQPNIDNRFGDLRRSPTFTDQEDTLKVVGVKASGADSLMMAFLVEGEEVASTTDDTLVYDFIGAEFGVGFHNMSFVLADSSGSADTTAFLVMVNPPITEMPRPQGVADGINVVDNSTVTLSLFAPFKQFVYVVGDFNNWFVDTDFLMNREVIREDSAHYWLTISGLDPDTEYAFQYLVDGNLRVFDPYAQLILTPGDDKFIPPSTFQNLKPYPQGKTEHNVGTFQIEEDEYQWQVTDFERPPKEKLVIYELLLRDFIAAHDYATLIDTLDYLERLGINAIELMPVNEFEGNISWGYNPAAYFAPDKYYGPPNDLKRFIDACHARGIAVILDTVLNHSFGQHTLVRLYSSGGFGPPTPENPWYNVTARHPFSIGFDFNHESSVTKAFVDRVNAYWLTEFKVDGFRFDLSKGFTQRNTLGNTAMFAQFDPTRVALLTRMANKIWDVDSTAYVILEHFADNEEEKILSDRGMMLWGNLNIAYSQSAMGFLSDPERPSDLSGGYFKTRGWSKPHLVTYMESHDEPWLMYKNLQFGRSSADGSYDVQDLSTALNRIKLVATFFFTIPGPKMMWQFGELGYDRELPESGGARTAPKPILWNYQDVEERSRLYRFISELINLRRRVPVFEDPTTGVQLQVAQGQAFRKIVLSHSSTNAVIVGNFGVEPLDANPGFFHGGFWYDYFQRDSLLVDSNFNGLRLEPGEFHLYTDAFIGFPDEVLVTSVQDRATSIPERFELFQNYPNPFNPETTVRFDVSQQAQVTLEIYNVLGQKIRTLLNKKMTPGEYEITWDGKNDSGMETSSGVYLLHLHAEGKQPIVRTLKMIKLK